MGTTDIKHLRHLFPSLPSKGSLKQSHYSPINFSGHSCLLEHSHPHSNLNKALLFLPVQTLLPPSSGIPWNPGNQQWEKGWHLSLHSWCSGSPLTVLASLEEKRESLTWICFVIWLFIPSVCKCWHSGCFYILDSEAPPSAEDCVLVLPFSCTPLERYLWAWFQLCDLLWYSSGQWKNLAALPSSPPIWKKHVSPIAALSFAFVIVGYSSLSAFVLLQATVSQKSLCLNMPTNPKVYFLALWSSWLCISWSNVGLVRFFLSGSFLFLKYTLVVQRSLWASISWLGSTNAIKSKLDHLFSRKASSIISSLEFTSSFTLAGNG